MMSDSFMIRSSSPSSFTSVPDHLPNRMRSPALTSRATIWPASLREPGPTAMTSPSIGFSWAVSGMMMPPRVFSSAFSRRTTTRSWRGRNFMDWFLISENAACRRCGAKTLRVTSPGQRFLALYPLECQGGVAGQTIAPCIAAGYPEPMTDLIVKNSASKGRGGFAARAFVAGETLEICPVIPLSAEDAARLDATHLYNYYFGWAPDDRGAAIALG